MSTYHSLQTSVTHRFRGNSLVNVNYTYSKALGNAVSPQDTYDIAAEYGPVNTTETQILVGDFVYQLPLFLAQNGIAGHLLGGWEISGIVSAHSGNFLTAVPPTADPAGLGLLATGTVAKKRPDHIANPNRNAPHTLSKWFNTAAFARVPAGQYRPGNASNDSIIGPGSQEWDLSLFRNIKISERAFLQLRAESYNTFNHTNFSAIAVNMQDSNYGQAIGAGAVRNMQLAVKINF